MKRGISFKFSNQREWDASTRDWLAAKVAPAALRMLDGMTLEAYAGSVPPDWNGEVVEVFDMFEMRRLERYHPELYDACARSASI